MKTTYACLMRYAPLLVVAACSGEIVDGSVEEDETGSATAALVSSTASPPLRTTVNGALPPLFLGRADAQGGIHNLASELNAAPGRSASAWVTEVNGNDTHRTSAALTARLNAAIADARDAVARRATDWEHVINGLEHLGPLVDVRVEAGTEVEQVFTFTPERVRWMSQETRPGFIRSISPPVMYNEIRQRGARLYCAAREAHEFKGPGGGGGASRMMGKKSLGSITVFGERIDFMSVEPTVAMSPPEPFMSSSNDGAQAFTIPLSVGMRVRPVSFLPSLPELRTPVTLVTADSETRSVANLPGSITQHWQTVTHADAFVASSRSGYIDPDSFVIFYIGPVPINLNLRFDIHSQSCARGEGSDPHQSCVPPNTHRSLQRLLDTTMVGYPGHRDGGTTGVIDDVMYNDDWWRLSAGLTSGYIANDTDEVVALPQTSPEGYRARLNNDKGIEVRTGVKTSGLTTVKTEYPMSYVTFVVEAGVGLSGGFDMVHSIREQMTAARRALEADEFPDLWGPWYAETGLSVTPSTEAQINFEAAITLELHLDVPILGTVRHFELGPWDIIQEDLNLASIASEGWDEENRLRIGTMTSYRPASALRSHWPMQDDVVTSFPASSKALSTCLATTPWEGDLHLPCESVEPEDETLATEAPTMNLCVVAELERPDWNPDYPGDACRYALFNFVRSGINSTVGTTHMSRMLGSLASRTQFNAAIGTCAQAGLDAEEIEDLFEVQACDPNARPTTRPLRATRRQADGATGDPDRCRPPS